MIHNTDSSLLGLIHSVSMHTSRWSGVSTNPNIIRSLPWLSRNVNMQTYLNLSMSCAGRQLYTIRQRVLSLFALCSLSLFLSFSLMTYHRQDCYICWPECNCGWFGGSNCKGFLWATFTQFVFFRLIWCPVLITNGPPSIARWELEVLGLLSWVSSLTLLLLILLLVLLLLPSCFFMFFFFCVLGRVTPL